MKLLLLALLALPSCLHAQAVTVVHEVATSTSSVVRTISVCNTVLDVVAATSSGTVSGSFAVELYTVAAATSTINCGFDASVSTNQYSANYGREVAAGSGVYFGIAIPSRKPYCLSQNSGGCTQMTVTQIK